MIGVSDCIHEQRFPWTLSAHHKFLRLGDTLDIITKDFALTFGASLSNGNSS